MALAAVQKKPAKWQVFFKALWLKAVFFIQPVRPAHAR
jgi:hypothetical protein